MGIRVFCPNGHRLHLKSFLAGKRGVCPHCQAKFDIPWTSDPAAEISARRQHEHRAAEAPGAQSSPEPGDVELVMVQPGPTPRAPPGWSRTEVEAETQSDPDSVQATPVPAAGPGSAAPRGEEAVMPPQVALGVEVATEPRPPGDFGSAAAVGPGPRSMAATPPPEVVTLGVDPLDLDPQAVWYIHVPTVGQFGPADAALVRKWLSEGRFGPGALIWRDGWNAWKLAGDVLPQAVFRYEAGVAGPGIVPRRSTGPTRGRRSAATVGRRDRAAWVLVLFALIALAISMLVLLLTILSDSAVESQSSAEHYARAHPVAVRGPPPSRSHGALNFCRSRGD
jgi:hypothetical protein